MNIHQGWRKELKPGGAWAHLNFDLHSSLGAWKCILGWQYSEKLTIPLASCIIILKISYLSCLEFESYLWLFRKILPARQYLGQFKQPAAGENFQYFVLKLVVQKQFGNGSRHR